MLLDHYLPHCDFYERHAITIRATPERVYETCRTSNLAQSRIAKLFLRMRGMKAGPRQFPPPNFKLLGEDPPREYVLGIEGPFWQPRCQLREVTPETFTGPVTGNAARGAWNFFVEPDGAMTRLSTETRVLCSDESRWKFRLYWMLIRPFSGLIRILMLRTIRKDAEKPVP
jgi:hypothetical protein